MDMPSSWLEELEMEDEEFMNQCDQMNKPYYYQMEDFSVDSFSSDSYTETPNINQPFDQSFQTHKCLQELPNMNQPFDFNKVDKITKKLPPTENPKLTLASDASNTFTISFGDIKPAEDKLIPFSKSYGFAEAGMKKIPNTVRNPIQVQDHVLAERKRREKLAQRFSSLSSLLPDLKKIQMPTSSINPSKRSQQSKFSQQMDKANVLEVAATYIQQLQSRIKELEGLSDTIRKNMKESVRTGKISRLISSSDDVGSLCNQANVKESSYPEIEVRTSECRLLVEIYSKTKCISLMKVLSEMQKMGLSIISCSTMPFADIILLVTVVAQKNTDFVMPSADLVKNLQLVI